MIKSFKHKGLEQYFTKDSKRLLNAQDVPRIERILDRLDAALLIEDMDIPGWNLHELKGNRKGTWSVVIRRNWRITFLFEKANAYNVDLEDYH